jgi:ribosomal protein L34
LAQIQDFVESKEKSLHPAEPIHINKDVDKIHQWEEQSGYNKGRGQQFQTKEIEFQQIENHDVEDSVKKIIMYGGKIRKTIMQNSSLMKSTMDGGITKKIVVHGFLTREKEMQGCRILKTEIQGITNKKITIASFQGQLK